METSTDLIFSYKDLNVCWSTSTQPANAIETKIARTSSMICTGLCRINREEAAEAERECIPDKHLYGEISRLPRRELIRPLKARRQAFGISPLVETGEILCESQPDSLHHLSGFPSLKRHFGNWLFARALVLIMAHEAYCNACRIRALRPSGGRPFWRTSLECQRVLSLSPSSISPRLPTGPSWT